MFPVEAPCVGWVDSESIALSALNKWEPEEGITAAICPTV